MVLRSQAPTDALFALFVAVALLASSSAAHAAEVAPSEQERLNHLALDLMVEGQTRVMRVADRIRIAAAPWCKRKVAPVIGVYAPDQHSLRDGYRDLDFVEPFVDAASARFGLQRLPRVVALVPGMPAEAAGLKIGDLVTAVDGKRSKKRIFLDVLNNRGKDGIVHLTAERNGYPVEIPVQATMGCNYPSRFAAGTAINAYATSFGALTGMYFYAGMLRFLPDDGDLALIAGHELAHLVLSHTSQGTREKNEADADYLGLYFAARAGFDITNAPKLWDRMARENPYSSIDTGFYTHPVGAKRSLALKATLEEIANRLAAGGSLEPTEARPRSVDVDEAAAQAHLETLRKEALAQLRADQQQIQTVSYRLATAGAPECGKQLAPVLGATLARRQDFGRAKAKEVKAAFGVGDDITVLAVAPSSPAERAGLQVGDRIERVNGSRIRRTTKVFDRLRSSSDGEVALQVKRSEERLDLTLPLEPGCPFGTVVFVGGTDTTHHKNRDDMEIPTGLLRFTRDDDELAIAIAHQMGHHVLKRFRSIEDEPAADAIGISIAHRAGFDVTKALAFWDRWASEQFWKISPDMDRNYGYIPHGGMSIRAPAIRAAVATTRSP